CRTLILRLDFGMRAMNAAIVVLSLAAIACSASAQRTPHQKVLLCYWASWSHYRVGNGKFSVKQMESTPCTHLIYAYAKIANGVIAPMDPNLDIQANDMKTELSANWREAYSRHCCFTHICWKEGSQRFSKIASSQRGRRTFADSVESFLDRHGFDGIDIDWRYPTLRGGSSEDKENFALLLEDLRATLDKKHRTLTVTVPALKQTISAAYDVSKISKHVDFMSVTGFDLFGPWNSFTGHPAPLRGRNDDSSHTLNDLRQIGENANVVIPKSATQETSIDNWISEGVDVSKLVLGMPLYGRTYTLEDPSEHGFNAPASGPGKPGPFTKEAGMLGYNEICTLLSSGGWDVTWDPDVNAPVMVKGDQWIGFDDAGSLTKKVELALQKGLAGAMVWSIDTDDFRGQCGSENNPLLEAIRKALKLNTDEFDPRTPAPPSLPCRTATREKFTCTKEGFFPRPVSDRRYIQCVKRGGRLEAREMECSRERAAPTSVPFVAVLENFGLGVHLVRSRTARFVECRTLILRLDFSMRALSSVIVTLALAAIACSASAQKTRSQKVLLCYWASWSHYRVGNGKFSAKQMEWTPCTHLIYAYAKIVNGVITPVDPNQDTKDNGMYRQFNALKRTKRDLKTLISVGGWKEGSQRFSGIASSQRGRRTFADSVESFLDRHGFDGIDIDWRYPTQRGGSLEDKENFALLLKDLRETLDKKRHILTVTVSGLQQTISDAYDVSELSKHVDFMSVTAFDLFGPWNSFTGHPAPLRGRADDSSDTLNVALNTASMHQRRDPVKPGPFTKEAGMLGYNEICTLLSSRGWDVTRDPDVNAPVMVKGDQWIGFDDAESLTKKKGLAGAVVWSIDTDDFRGQCGWEKNPLLEAIRKALQLNTDEPDPSTPAPTRPPCQPETPQKFKCTKEGFVPHPESDQQYIQCVKRGRRLEAKVVYGKKRRKTSQSPASQSKEKTNQQVGFTVLYMPTNTSKVESLSKFKMTDYLNNVVPDVVSVVRVKKARNIVAVDAKKPALKAELLKLAKQCAMPVRAFLPSDRTNCYGVLRDIEPDCTEHDIKTRPQSTACITEVRRLDKTSPVVGASFATKVAPQHCNVGLVRTKVIPYRSRLLQCYRCHIFGHIAAASAEEFQLCSRCGQCHKDKCKANPCCVNCHGNHASSAPVYQVEARGQK
ncbi:hypothetical protein HPB47_022255, partial [Ixodes persulcatus]